MIYIFLVYPLFILKCYVDYFFYSDVNGEKPEELFSESDEDFDPRGNDSTVINNNARNATSDVPLGSSRF